MTDVVTEVEAALAKHDAHLNEDAVRSYLCPLCVRGSQARRLRALVARVK